MQYLKKRYSQVGVRMVLLIHQTMFGERLFLMCRKSEMDLRFFLFFFKKN